VNRRGGISGAVAFSLALLVLGLALTSLAGAAVPVGPRLATVELIESQRPRHKESSSTMALATVDPSTGRERRFVRAPLEASGRIAPSPFHAPAWSPDGSLIAFTGYASGETDTSRIFVVSPNGSGVRPLPGTRNGSDPVLSPDGHTLAFARTKTLFHIDVEHVTEPGKDRSRFYSSTTTWVVDLLGGPSRRLTRWRNGLSNVPGSFTPDGSGLLLTKEDDDLDGPRIVQVNLADGSSREVIQLAEEPAISPDGTRLAFVGYLHPDLVEAEENQGYLAGDLYVAQADGSHAQRITRTDDVLESSPSWDPSGQRIAYVQARADTSFVPVLGLLFPTGNALMQVNADGRCRKKVLTERNVAFYGVAWQSGPGHEAGPNPC
jgi:Tol biopolymer transport system component